MINPTMISHNKTLDSGLKSFYVQRKSINPQGFMIEIRLFRKDQESFFYLEKFKIQSLRDYFSCSSELAEMVREKQENVEEITKKVKKDYSILLYDVMKLRLWSDIKLPIYMSYKRIIRQNFAYLNTNNFCQHSKDFCSIAGRCYNSTI